MSDHPAPGSPRGTFAPKTPFIAWILVATSLVLFYVVWIHPVRIGRGAGKLVARESVVTWVSPVEPLHDAVDSERARVQFRLDNPGGSPVTIGEIEKSCGCVSVTLDRGIVKPGETALITARPTPFPVGERTVTVSIHTDSVATPRLDLRIQSIGSRVPPFVLRAGGDLFYRDGTPSSSSRGVLVTTVEAGGTKETPPPVSANVPFLEIGQPMLQDEGAYQGTDAVFRKYSYPVRLLPSAATHDMAGEVVITDPWQPSQVVRVLARYERTPPIRVAPSVLLVDRRTASAGCGTRLFVFAEGSADTVRAEADPESPITVKRLSDQTQGEGLVFSVGLKPEARPTAGETYRVRVRRTGAVEAALTVPVVLSGGQDT